MSPEPDDLAQALARDADAATQHPIDLDAVLRGSRARRRTRRRAVVGATASAAGVLVVGALAFGVGGLGANQATTAGSSSADAPADPSGSPAGRGDDASEESGSDAGAGAVAPQDGAQFGDDALVASPDAVNRCGAPIAQPTDAATAPLTVEVVAPAGAVAPGAEGVALVRLANEGSTTVDGFVRPAPSITVSDAGTTVWIPSLSLADDLVRVRLAPGEQTQLEARFTAASCTASGERDGAIAADPPPLPAGAYELSAVVAFSESPEAEAVLVVSATAPLAVG